MLTSANLVLCLQTGLDTLILNEIDLCSDFGFTGQTSKCELYDDPTTHPTYSIARLRGKCMQCNGESSIAFSHFYFEFYYLQNWFIWKSRDIVWRASQRLCSTILRSLV